MTTPTSELTLRDALYILIGYAVMLSILTGINWATGTNFYPSLISFLGAVVGGVLGMKLARRMRQR